MSLMDRKRNGFLVVVLGVMSACQGFFAWKPAVGAGVWISIGIGLLLGVSGILLVGGHASARWTAWAGWVGLVLFVGFPLVESGWNVLRISCVGLLWFVGFVLWRTFHPWQLDAESRGPIVSLALLLRRPRFLDARSLARYIESAWGGRYSVVEAAADADEGSADGGFVTGASPLFMVGSPHGLFVVHNRDTSYYDDPKAAAEAVSELHTRKIIEENRAWIAVDLMEPSSAQHDATLAYSHIGKLIADLAGPDCLAICRPETGEVNVWDEELEVALRGANALSIFDVPVKTPVFQADPEHPAMMAAVSEARSRWSEFVDAFRRKEGENFSIKAPVTSGGHREYIWIEVDRIESDQIHGRLGNHPVELEPLKLGSAVTVAQSEVNDWGYLLRGELKGTFTAKVIMEMQSESESVEARGAGEPVRERKPRK